MYSYNSYKVAVVQVKQEYIAAIQKKKKKSNFNKLEKIYLRKYSKEKNKKNYFFNGKMFFG